MKHRFAVLLGVLLAAAWLAVPGSASASNGGQGACIAHHPAYVEDVFEPHYSAGCSGHDEPELNPLSTLPGSGRDVTWTFTLPSNGSHYGVDAVGPTFWFGGPVTDPDSLFGQAFLEVQFYPNSVVTGCTPNGGFKLKQTPGAYGVCTPVWSLTQTGTKGVYHEPAAFNAMLTRNGTGQSLVMHQGDRIRMHLFVTSAKDGWHIAVSDLTTGQSGTIVLNSASGPLMPAYSVAKIGNSLPWGLVHDAPIAFVWEIGHTSPYTSPGSAFCWPGEDGCFSYDRPAWADQSPIKLESVTFNGGAKPSGWAVVSDYGGKAEITDPTETGSTCSGYGGPFCIYPWYTQNHDGSFSYGVDYPTTADDFGKANQFQQKLNCGGPFGPDSTYCATRIR
jgi:hypothetical protein